MAHEHFYVKRSERESLVQPELIYTGLLEDAPNWFNIQHSHDFCEILYVAGGAGEAILEGKKFRLAPGDLVVVRRQQTAENGEIVVALLEDEATVKRLSRKNGQIWLLPENDAYQPIDGTNAQILGKVTAVVRQYC